MRHTHTHTHTAGRTPFVADALPTQPTTKRLTPMPSAGFERAIPGIERPQTYVLEHSHRDRPSRSVVLLLL